MARTAEWYYNNVLLGAEIEFIRSGVSHHEALMEMRIDPRKGNLTVRARATCRTTAP